MGKYCLLVQANASNPDPRVLNLEKGSDEVVLLLINETRVFGSAWYLCVNAGKGAAIGNTDILSSRKRCARRVIVVVVIARSLPCLG